MLLMSYNVNYADDGRADTIAAIEQADADVVLLQEITESWRALLAHRLAKRYPHMVFHVAARAAGGQAVLSKLPITDDRVLPAALEHWFPAEHVTIAAPFGPVDILHVHLRPAILDGSWVKGYFETPPLRLREIEAYWRQLRTPPMVVAGDYNEEPGKGVLEFLRARGLERVDTGTALTTWSWVGTFGGKPASLALDIDHVAIDPTRLVAANPHVVDGGKSDHRPVVVTLSKR